MTLQEMLHYKKLYGLTNEAIAASSGVPLSTVMKIFSGQTRRPRRETFLALEEAFRKEMSLHRPYGFPSGTQTPGVREPGAVYGSRSADSAPLRTTEDYYALPDDQRVELINGVFYDMAAPTTLHQGLLVELTVLFRQCIAEHGSPCRVFAAPCDVQLNGDIHTMVQPDILVVCDREKLQEKVVFGAPDLVVEIVSPASVRIDCLLKLNKYRSAGVREYWIVDPLEKVIHVYLFDQEDHYLAYTFRDDIPVGISGGKCVIPFAQIDDYLK